MWINLDFIVLLCFVDMLFPIIAIDFPEQSDASVLGLLYVDVVVGLLEY